MRFQNLTAWLASAALVSFAAGCGDGKSGYKDVPKGTKVKETAHEHAHVHGPHGGHIVELGEEEYHAEVTYNATKKKLEAYLLGKDAKSPQLTDQKEVTFNLTINGKPVQLKGTAAPLKGEPEGKSSHFEAPVTDEHAGYVRNIEYVKGRLTVSIDGKSYTGDLQDEHGHDHDDHDHDHDKEGKDKK